MPSMCFFINKGSFAMRLCPALLLSLVVMPVLSLAGTSSAITELRALQAEYMDVQKAVAKLSVDDQRAALDAWLASTKDKTQALRAKITVEDINAMQAAKSPALLGNLLPSQRLFHQALREYADGLEADSLLFDPVPEERRLFREQQLSNLRTLAGAVKKERASEEFREQQAAKLIEVRAVQDGKLNAHKKFNDEIMKLPPEKRKEAADKFLK